jgi:serine/threonine-protein kinase RsbW
MRLGADGGGMTSPNSEPESLERIVELRLPSRLGYEKIAMDAATSLARRMGFATDRVEALRTALAEAVTNAIEHGNAHDSAMKVMVVLAVRPDELSVTVADQGRKHLDTEQTTLTPKIEDSFDKPDKGGWGIWLIRELMDEVEFSTAPSGGNQVRMVIHLEA